jgi:hypothetical protein
MSHRLISPSLLAALAKSSFDKDEEWGVNGKGEVGGYEDSAGGRGA